MTTCRCGASTHRDFPDKTERCSACDRKPRFCGCEPADSRPVWLRRASERRFGLAKDLTAA